MTTTGAIITTISTDMFHHCGPRVVFWADTSTGMVCALALERKRASRYSFHARISTRRKVATRPDRTSGSAMVKKTRNFDAPSISALSSRSSGNTSKEVARQPHDDGQVDRCVCRDQCDLGVEQPELLEHHIDRQHRHDGRHDAVGDDPELDVVVADRQTRAADQRQQRDNEQRGRNSDCDLPLASTKVTTAAITAIEQDHEDRHGSQFDLEADAHQRIGGQRTDQHGEQSAHQRDDDRIPDRDRACCSAAA